MGALNKERFLFSQVDFYGQFLQSERGARVEAKQWKGLRRIAKRSWNSATACVPFACRSTHARAFFRLIRIQDGMHSRLLNAVGFRL